MPTTPRPRLFLALSLLLAAAGAAALFAPAPAPDPDPERLFAACALGSGMRAELLLPALAAALAGTLAAYFGLCDLMYPRLGRAAVRGLLALALAPLVTAAGWTAAFHSVIPALELGVAAADCRRWSELERQRIERDRPPSPELAYRLARCAG